MRYWLQSSHTLNVLLSPGSSGLGSGPSSMILPLSSSIPSISQPLTYLRPTWGMNGWLCVIFVPADANSNKIHHKNYLRIILPMVLDGWTQTKKQASCFRRFSHSFLISRRTFKCTVTSALTRAGRFSPILGRATSTTVNPMMGWAIRAQPPK